MLKIIGLIVLLALLAVGVSFSTLNASPVQIDYYFGKSDIPLALALIVALASGALLGLLGTMSAFLKQKRQILKLKKLVRSTENELAHVRAAPTGKDSA